MARRGRPLGGAMPAIFFHRRLLHLDGLDLLGMDPREAARLRQQRHRARKRLKELQGK